MKKKKSIKKNTVLNIIKTSCSIIFPLITFPYVSRILLPDNIGKVSFAQSFINYFILLAGFGIGTYAVRECSVVSDEQNKLNSLSSELFSINIISTLISYIFLFLILIAFDNNYEKLITLQSIVILFNTLGADWINTSMEDFKYITIRNVLFQLLSIFLIFIFVKSPNDYYKYMIITVFSTIGPNIINIWYRKRYCDIKFTLNINWKKHIPSILSLFIMELSYTIYNNVDITMLGYMKDDYQVGIYTVAYKIMRLISQVIQSLNMVIIPRLSYYFSRQDFDNVNKLLRKILSFNISLGLPICVGAYMLSDDICYLIGGSEYLGADSILRILILMFFFNLFGISFIGSAILIPTKKEKTYMKVCLITAIFNVIINMLLIPKFSAIGAAIASAINGLISFLMLYFVKKDKRINIKKKKDLILAPLEGILIIIIVCKVFSNIPNLLTRIICSTFISMLSYFIILLINKYELLYELINENYRLKKILKIVRW